MVGVFARGVARGRFTRWCLYKMVCQELKNFKFFGDFIVEIFKE
jgi:hypothetical protein